MAKEDQKIHSFQRRYLRGLAHKLNPVVQVGQSGVTESVIKAVKDALSTHELIKIKMEQPEDKKSMASALAEKSQSALCGLVGHVVILYRAHPEKPQIVLPKR
jgi:RNA-binding protein